MRCPYCSGLNPDNTNFCIRCGRDLIASTPNSTAQRPTQPARPAQNQPVRPAQPQTGYQAPPPRPAVPPGSPKPALSSQPPIYPPQPIQYTQPSTYPPGSTRNVPSTPTSRPGTIPATTPTTTIAKNVAVNPPARKPSTVDPHVLPPPLTAANEAPTPFPPETVRQMETLLQGALPYTLVTDAERYGKKKIVRIAYRQCAGWQQVGTLLKALKEYDAPELDTIVIQGAFEQDKNTYYYTNGQLTFDRHVRLGSLVQNRYQIETGNGLSSDSVRFVISE